MKKTPLTLFIFALSFSMFAQKSNAVSDWQVRQDSIRNEILNQRENTILKESFLQEKYIRNVVRVASDSLFVLIPFDLDGFGCNSRNCYSIDVSFSFKLGDRLEFPKTLLFTEHWHGACWFPKEVRYSGIFRLQEQTDEHVIYHSTEHNRTLVLFRHGVTYSTAYYFFDVTENEINGENVYDILVYGEDFLDRFWGFSRSWVLTTNEYENFLCWLNE